MNQSDRIHTDEEAAEKEPLFSSKELAGEIRLAVKDMFVCDFENSDSGFTMSFKNGSKFTVTVFQSN